MRSLRLAPIVAIGFFLAVSSANADGGARVTTTIAKKQILNPTISAYGTVAADPNGVTTIAMPREGIVRAVNVRVGDLVPKGAPLVTILTSPAAAAQYAQGQSAFQFAQRDLAHTRSLFGEQLVTRSQLAAAEKAYADANAQLAQLGKIGANKTIEVLSAPAPGIVVSVGVSPGDHIQANAAVVSIATRDKLILNIGLEPFQATQVQVGARARIHSSQDQTLDFAGTVTSVNAMMDPQSRLVNAIVAVPRDIAARLILGMAFQVDVNLMPQYGIVVPRSSLLTDGTGTYVYTVSKGRAHRRDVSVRLETASQALLAKGVSLGEQVVIAGNAGLKDGMTVRTH